MDKHAFEPRDVGYCLLVTICILSVAFALALLIAVAIYVL